MSATKLVVIGAGPGGYTAAFHAADLGLSVTLIDQNADPGGVCLYRGCIPSKALLHAGHTLRHITEASNYGISCSKPEIDLARLRSWKEGVVRKLTGGLGQLTKARKITYIQGTARFLSSSALEVIRKDGRRESLSFDKAILATGSSPVSLPTLPHSPRILDSTTALEIPEIPSSLLVIGGGYIGLELGSAYASLGTAVTLVETLPDILSGVDKDIADILKRQLKKTFSKIMTGTKVTHAQETSDGIQVTFTDAKGAQTSAVFSHILVAVGRRPNTQDLGLENTKVKICDRGFIRVTPGRRSDDENIFAIGDITGQPMLAHKASAEAKVAVAAIMEKDAAFAPRSIPAVVFTDPELAWCGMTEDQARAQNLDVTASKFPWAASGRALTIGRTDGMTKIIAEKKTGRLMGIAIVGVNAGDMISEGSLAIEKGLTADDLAGTIHPHPTLAETLMETAEGLFGNYTHIKK